MSIFDFLPKPAERVRSMLIRELESRRSRDMDAGNWSPAHSYCYRGGADLVLQHGSFSLGRYRPERYEHLRGEPGQCFPSALHAAEQDPDLTYVEGYAVFGGRPFQHGWCVAPDGGVVDLTMPTEAEMPFALDYRTLMPMALVPVTSWGYYGVTFARELVRVHGDTLSLPLLDRGLAEVSEHPGDELYSLADHGYPILKVPYDPDRKVLP